MQKNTQEKISEVDSPASISNGTTRGTTVDEQNSIVKDKNDACAAFFTALDQDDEDEQGLPWPYWMDGDSLAPPCPSNLDVIDELLNLASVTCSDEVIDLGAGDGRVCLRAATRYGVRAVGVEIDGQQVNKFQKAIEALGLDEQVQVIHGDVREYSFADVSATTVLCLYLLPEAIQELRPMLDAALEAGSRVVCNTWGLPWLEPVERRTVGALHNADVFLYTYACLGPNMIGSSEGGSR